MTSFDDPRGRQSEQLAFEAERAARAGDLESARRLYEQAAELEEQVVSDAPLDQPRIKSVLAVSAVALWLKARRFRRSQALARHYLATTFLGENDRRELRSLVQAARLAEGAVDSGTGSTSTGQVNAADTYRQILDFQAWRWMNDPSSRHIDKSITDELEVLWEALSETDRNSIDHDLEALDTLDKTGEFSLQDNENDKLAEGPRAVR